MSQRLSGRIRLGAIALALTALGLTPILALRSARPSAEAEAKTPPRLSIGVTTRLTGDPGAAARFTGYAFDACQAPRQDQMDAWLRRSPYRGVGIYIAGGNRLCRVQKNLDPEWVSRQTRKGWHLLPLTVGRQAACTHVDHWQKISARPDDGYATARGQGRLEAEATARAADRLGIPAGSTMWLDMEVFDIADPRCRASTLAFVSGWTDRLHQLHLRSGYYSGGASGLRMLEAARRDPARRYAVPDEVWVADWNGNDGDLSRGVSAGGWAAQRLVHQYVGSHVETHGGVRLEIDSSFADVGPLTVPAHAGPGCGLPRDFGSYPPLGPGQRNTRVAALQCFLHQAGAERGAVTGTYDLATVQAVRAFQHARRLPVTGRVDRRTWVALLAKGSSPSLRYGASNDDVRRVQRVLNAAGGEGLAVDGAFGGATRAAVRRYQHRHHLAPSGTVTKRVWELLQAGR